MSWHLLKGTRVNYFSHWKIININLCIHELIVPLACVIEIERSIANNREGLMIDMRIVISGHPFCNGNWHFFSETPRVIASE